MTDGAKTILDAIAASLRKAGAYNRDDQASPVAVLWTDRERQWTPLVARLRTMLPLFTLGPYDPEQGIGPAYWLRFALGSGDLDGRAAFEANGALPVVYLPGISRSQLRAVEECAPELRPIAELQYRSAFWSHRNGRDWTVPAFLSSADGGLGIETGGDVATRDALLLTLPLLADIPLSRLRRELPLRAEYFLAVANPDEARAILEWLDEPTSFRRSREDQAWEAFRQQAVRQFGFDPETDDPIEAATLLGGREGRWATVWERFKETPARYPTLPTLLRTARPSDRGQLTLFQGSSESWPQDNDEAETTLRDALLALAELPATDARATVMSLDSKHSPRRDWVWHALGRAPLAAALEHLRDLAEWTGRSPGGVNATAIGNAYIEWGWRADSAALSALAAVETEADAAAVKAVLRSIYRPWLDAAARALQVTWEEAAPTRFQGVLGSIAEGTCVLFADGLRFDLACQLEALLAPNVACDLTWCFGPLPGVTLTAKPAISPVACELVAGPDFAAAVAATGTRLAAEGFRKLLLAAGWQWVPPSEVGDPAGLGWTEAGAIDQAGHVHGWKLAHHVAGELRAVSRRIEALLGAGWEKVVVVTDHGWLLLPGGLPKAELPEHLTEARKGRCARLKPGAMVSEQTVPWFWDSQVRIAVARGIGVYVAGSDYEHGGISPQECVLPILTVTRSAPRIEVTISSVAWSGMRCRLTVHGAPEGAIADLRRRVGDAETSIVDALKPLSAQGNASLVVEDEDREGEAVHVVVLDGAGRIVAQEATTVGG